MTKSPDLPREDAKFARLRRARRLWAIGPAPGDLRRLRALHERIAERIEPGDRLVYLGGYRGKGADILGTIEELLAFRRQILALPFMFPFDIAYLRGQGEEIWAKLLQLQQAAKPREILAWMLDRGLGADIVAYGGDPAAGIVACRSGAVAIARWTELLRRAQQARAGHGEWQSSLKRAAYTDDGHLLFVHAGLNPAQGLADQGDVFWWGHPGFAEDAGPYGGFRRIVRGIDPASGNAAFSPEGYVLTLDGRKDRPQLGLLAGDGAWIEGF